MARPTKLTPQVQHRVVAALARGASLSAVADQVGVDRGTLQRAIARDAAFAAQVTAAKQQGAAKRHERRAAQDQAASSATTQTEDARAAQRARARADAEARYTHPDAPLTTLTPAKAERIARHRTPAPGSHTTLTESQRAAAQDLFLDEYANNGNISSACRKAAIGRSTFYGWLEHDVAFEVRYHEAQERAKDMVRGAIFRRAVLGTRRPLHQNGRLVTQRDKDGNEVPVTVTEYSDALLMFHAKALMPEYRERTQQQVEISGPGGTPLHPGTPPPDAHTFTLSLRGMSDEDLAALHAIMARAAQREREGEPVSPVGAAPYLN